MSSSNSYFLTCKQISQEACKVVWYSHLFKNFSQFIVIHTVKGIVVNESEVGICLEFTCFFYDPTDVGNLISYFSAFSKSNLYIWKFSVHILLKPNLKDFEHYFLTCEMSAVVWLLEHSWASLIAQLVKNCLQCRRPQFDSWVRKNHWRKDRLPTPVFLGFSGGSDGKEFACHMGDLGSIPRLGRSPRREHGNPLQYSCLGNPHGQRSLAGCSPWVHKESDITEQLSTAQIFWQEKALLHRFILVYIKVTESLKLFIFSFT